MAHDDRDEAEQRGPSLEELERLVREGLYTAVGIGILGFQRLQVARHDLRHDVQASAGHAARDARHAAADLRAAAQHAAHDATADLRAAAHGTAEAAPALADVCHRVEAQVGEAWELVGSQLATLRRVLSRG